MKILVSGGTGSFGSALVRLIINLIGIGEHNIDKLTDAVHLKSFELVADSGKYQFEQLGTCNTDEIDRIVNEFQLKTIIHLSGESNSDCSIYGSMAFIKTNINRIDILLEHVKKYWQNLVGKQIAIANEQLGCFFSYEINISQNERELC